MKNKLIIILTFLIFGFVLYIQHCQNLTYKKQIENLEKENRIFERQIEKNINDLAKRNEELKNATLLQKEADKINDTCLSNIINPDFANLLYKNNL